MPLQCFIQCKTLDKITDKKLKHTQHSRGGAGFTEALQCRTRGAGSRTEQNSVGTHKGQVPKQVWGRIEKERFFFFQVWASEEVQK